MKRPSKCSIAGPASSAYRLTADTSATPSTAEITYATGVGSVVIDSPRLCRLLSGGSAALTNGQAPDGHHRRGKSPRWLLSVHGDALRLILETGIDRWLEDSCSTRCWPTPRPRTRTGQHARFRVALPPCSTGRTSPAGPACTLTSRRRRRTDAADRRTVHRQQGVPRRPVPDRGRQPRRGTRHRRGTAPGDQARCPGSRNIGTAVSAGNDLG